MRVVIRTCLCAKGSELHMQMRVSTPTGMASNCQQIPYLHPLTLADVELSQMRIYNLEADVRSVMAIRMDYHMVALSRDIRGSWITPLRMAPHHLIHVSGSHGMDGGPCAGPPVIPSMSSRWIGRRVIAKGVVTGWPGFSPLKRQFEAGSRKIIVTGKGWGRCIRNSHDADFSSSPCRTMSVIIKLDHILGQQSTGVHTRRVPAAYPEPKLTIPMASSTASGP